MSLRERGGALGAPSAILIVLGIIIAAALSFNLGQNAVRVITVTQTTTNAFTFTSTQVSTSTVTVTTTPPDYFQVNSLVLHSGTASSRLNQGTANLQFTVTGPLLTTSSSNSAIIAILLSNSTMTVNPSIYQCASSSSCSLLSAVLVRQFGVTHFDTSASAFYVGVIITKGQSYNYNILFSNGNSVAGTLVAS